MQFGACLSGMPEAALSFAHAKLPVLYQRSSESWWNSGLSHTEIKEVNVLCENFTISNDVMRLSAAKTDRF